ncbi:hypothetical protein DIPPA_13951 [Diplonema papillatum]|nr:hypothetical protein DIPPA_13951 [Diplonema papillatum]
MVTADLVLVRLLEEAQRLWETRCYGAAAPRGGDAVRRVVERRRRFAREFVAVAAESIVRLLRDSLRSASVREGERGAAAGSAPPSSLGAPAGVVHRGKIDAKRAPAGYYKGQEVVIRLTGRGAPYRVAGVVAGGLGARVAVRVRRGGTGKRRCFLLRPEALCLRYKAELDKRVAESWAAGTCVPVATSQHNAASASGAAHWNAATTEEGKPVFRHSVSGFLDRDEALALAGELAVGTLFRLFDRDGYALAGVSPALCAVLRPEAPRSPYGAPAAGDGPAAAFSRLVQAIHSVKELIQQTVARSAGQARVEPLYPCAAVVSRTCPVDSGEGGAEWRDPKQLGRHRYWDPHVDVRNVSFYDYSAVLYLTDGFEGGDLLFYDGRLGVQRLRPRAGTLAVFSGGDENPHSVEPVSSGVRLAVAMWFSKAREHRLPVETFPALSDRILLAGRSCGFPFDWHAKLAASLSIPEGDPLRLSLTCSRDVRAFLSEHLGASSERVIAHFFLGGIRLRRVLSADSLATDTPFSPRLAEDFADEAQALRQVLDLCREQGTLMTCLLDVCRG